MSARRTPCEGMSIRSAALLAAEVVRGTTEARPTEAERRQRQTEVAGPATNEEVDNACGESRRAHRGNRHEVHTPAIRCDIRGHYSFRMSRPNFSHKAWRSPRPGFGNLCSLLFLTEFAERALLLNLALSVVCLCGTVHSGDGPLAPASPGLLYDRAQAPPPLSGPLSSQEVRVNEEPYIGRSCLVLLCAFGHGLGYRRDGLCRWRCEPFGSRCSACSQRCRCGARS
jgi:ribosomal protein L32